MKKIHELQSVRLNNTRDALIILNQDVLPEKEEYLTLTTPLVIREAILNLKVRGAPAIGIAAAYGVCLGIIHSTADTPGSLFSEFREAKTLLASSRPTAVNLQWALDRMEKRFKSVNNQTVAEIKTVLLAEAEEIRREDEQVCRSIGEYSLSLLEKGWGILTHCNPGTIATARYGTALAPLYFGQERGYGFRVYADETRPLLQGARLTAWELRKASIDVTLICDSSASVVMQQGKIHAVLVGADRVAANGDTAYKIGTAGLAVLAKHYGIPFYVHAPLSTVDLTCSEGKDIIIEERPPEEITEKWYSHRMAPEGVKVYNPAFDVTEAGLITAIITEKGIVRPPYKQTLKTLMNEDVY